MVSSAESKLFGRAAEQQFLASALATARTGRGRLVLVSGEAGIGKTALVEDLARSASASGCLVLTGRCYDLSTTPPYGPWLEIVRQCPRVDGLSSLSAILGDGAGSDDGELRGTADLLSWALELFGALASARPLVLLLDDLHWSDEASLDALRRIAREIARLPILLIAIYRDDELTRRHPLYELIPLLVREAQAERLVVRALQADDMRAWLGALYPIDPADLQRLAGYVQRYSDGNPLFIAELLRTLENDRIITGGSGGYVVGDLAGSSVPLLLRQILDRRLGGTSSEMRELLSIAAVIGQSVSLQVWRETAAADATVLERAAREALDVGVLVEDPGRHSLAFRHALIREMLYQDLLPSRRQVWHRRVAEQLMAASDPDPDEVAHHLRQAGDPRSIEWLIRAGDRAYRGAYALRTAARRYEAALELVGTRHDQLATRGWLLVRLALVRRYADAGQGVLLLNDAAEIAARLADDGLAAMALWLRGTMRFYAGENGLADLEAADAALAALDAAAVQRIARAFGRPMPGRITRQAGLVWWHGYHGRPADALDLAERLAGRFEPTARGDIDRGICEAGQAFALSVLGRIQEARASYHEARRLLEERRYGFYVVTVTSFEFYLLDLPYFTTNLDERERKAQILRGFAEREGQEAMQNPPDIGISGHLLIAGKWDGFPAMLAAVQSGPRSFFIWNYALPVLANHARHTGAPTRARELLHSLFPQGPDTPVGTTGVPLRVLEVMRLGGELALDAGDLDEAAGWIAAHERWLHWSGYALGRADGSLLQARYRRLAGDGDAARAHAARALQQASEPPQPLALIAAHRLLAELDISKRQGDSARQHLGTALELADACAAPYERALTLLVAGRLDYATGDDAAARSKLEAALALCAPLGARPAHDAAQRLLDELNSRPAGSVLSARELEVLALVADGLTDREVAARLYISPRTVNQHLRSVYNKLGVGSRAAATRRALELDLFARDA